MKIAQFLFKWKCSRSRSLDYPCNHFDAIYKQKRSFNGHFLFSDALFILTSTPKQRFEFIFTDYGMNPAHFSSVFEIYKKYQSTSLYRELKLRGAILTDGQLGILPQEQVYKQLNGVYNLSSDQGNLGCFIITNIRLVWFADANESFNISLPFMQMVNLRIRESKYGLALVIQTAQTAGNYVLGFRIDPQEKLHEIHKELSSLFAVYSQTPIFGVSYDLKAMVRKHHSMHAKCPCLWTKNNFSHFCFSKHTPTHRIRRTTYWELTTYPR